MKTADVIGKNLRTYRKKKGLTQERLAALAYISAAEISLIERGASNPMPSTVENIARALCIPATDLYRVEEIDLLSGEDGEDRESVYLRMLYEALPEEKKKLTRKLLWALLDFLQDDPPRNKKKRGAAASKKANK